MCVRSHSESGHGGRFESCEAYIKILSEKTRLEGRCAGLEEGNKINLERIKRQDAQLAGLLAENEALTSDNKRVRDYSTSLHDFIQWLSQRHEHDGLTKNQIIHMAAKLDVGGKWQDDHVKFDGRTAIELLEAENAALRQELESSQQDHLDTIIERDALRQERDRLAGVVAGLEEQNARNIEALRRAEAENARLLEEVERQSPYRIRLYNDLLGSQALVEEVLADNKRLREALKAVEWNGPRFESCPYCNEAESHGHYDDCLVGNALKEVG